MTLHEIAQLRLASQWLVAAPQASPETAITWMGAMQAQDYPGAKWSLGLRVAQSTEATIESAVTQGAIIRTWPMRGTLHFVPTNDALWMLSATAARPIAAAASRHKQLGLTDEILARGTQVLTNFLSQTDGPIIRKDLMTVLEKNGIHTHEQRGYHIIWWAAQHGLIAVGPLHDKQPTFVSLPSTAKQLPSTQDAITTLAARYFQSHGPASVKDFAWWSGLKISDARAAIERISNQLQSASLEGTEYWFGKQLTSVAKPSVLLLPGFDEYLLGYADRSAALHIDHASKIVPGGNGMFMPTIVVDGHVEGTWKRTISAKKVTIQLTPFAPILRSRHAELKVAAERYGNYLNLPVDLQKGLA